jgi:hypothetical protein
MRSGSPRSVFLRLMLAVLFGVMSIVPVPLRALAHPATHHSVAVAPVDHGSVQPHGHGAAHHHGAQSAAQAPNREPATSAPEGGVICQSAACCMAVTHAVATALSSVLHPIGPLAIPAARTIVAVTPDPVVPPPRVQV